MEVCACCGGHGGDEGICHCSACKVTPYCSRPCQRQHWPQHKTFCKAAKHKRVDVMEVCACCGGHGEDEGIHHCSACKVTPYCSRPCQRQHWPQHKKFCKAARHKTVDVMEVCACCGGDEGISHCSACKVTPYCSRPCQRQHWPQHKKFCKAARHKDNGNKGKQPSSDVDTEMDTGEVDRVCVKDGQQEQQSAKLMTCQKCGIQRPDMNMCGSCRDVTYCSRDCQRADWRTHRVTCRATHKEDADSGKGGAPCTDHQQQEELSALTSALSKVTLTSDSTSEWAEARARAGELFPGHRIVDKIRDLQSDMMGKPSKERMVAVMKIGIVYPHFLRQGRCLQDADGKSSFVLFHTPDNPRPHFSYDQLREGNFLLFQHAFLHFFADGTMGFRIDEAREVRIVEPQRSRGGDAPSTATSSQQWDRAMSRARKEFPHQRIVDSLHSMVHQDLETFTNILSMHIPTLTHNKIDPTTVDRGEVRGAVLLFLESIIPHPSIGRWVVKDRMGHRANLDMLLPMLLPVSILRDLRPGSFVCVSQPQVTKQHDFYTIDVKDLNHLAVIGV